MELANSWIWLIFIAIGLLMILLELLVGIETGLDLAFLGSALIIGGLATWPFQSWVLTLTVTLLISATYVVLGRKYVHKWTATKTEKTNIDTIIGKRGVVLQSIAPHAQGRVKIGNEEWRARAEEIIEVNAEIIVVDIHGVTLTVEKTKGDV
ncbi:MAG: NfeD family protein [Dehalococcoidales bacterium]|nr:NfeD family protein [Dehalococcoidales bacterium]